MSDPQSTANLTPPSTDNQTPPLSDPPLTPTDTPPISKDPSLPPLATTPLESDTPVDSPPLSDPNSSPPTLPPITPPMATPPPPSDQKDLEDKAKHMIEELDSVKPKKTFSTKKIAGFGGGLAALALAIGGLLVSTGAVQIPGIGDPGTQAVDSCWCTGSEQCPSNWNWSGGSGYCTDYPNLQCCSEPGTTPAQPPPNNSTTCSPESTTATSCRGNTVGTACTGFPGTCVKGTGGNDTSGRPYCACIPNNPLPENSSCTDNSNCASGCCPKSGANAFKCSHISSCDTSIKPPVLPDCINGTWRCDVGWTQQCVNDTWKAVQYCPTGTKCQASTNNSSATCVAINTCTDATNRANNCSCTAHTQCASQYCSGNVCLAKPADLLSCEIDSQCTPTHGQQARCTGGVCVAGSFGGSYGITKTNTCEGTYRGDGSGTTTGCESGVPITLCSCTQAQTANGRCTQNCKTLPFTASVNQTFNFCNLINQYVSDPSLCYHQFDFGGGSAGSCAAITMSNVCPTAAPPATESPSSSTPPATITYTCNSNCTTTPQCQEANANYICSSGKCRHKDYITEDDCQPPVPPAEKDFLCQSLVSSIPTPTIGDTLSFTCAAGGEGLDKVTKAEFQYSIDGGNFYTVGMSTFNTSNRSALSANLVITKPGTYDIQCRVCSDAKCSEWDTPSNR